MLTKILGLFWIIIGVLWLVKPEILRARMGKKTGRKFRWGIYGVLFFLVLNLAGMAFQLQGLLFKIIGIIGIIALVRVLLGAQSKAMDRFLEWWSGLPLMIFRIMALGALATGIALFTR